jgi:hypothetical protein
VGHPDHPAQHEVVVAGLDDLLDLAVLRGRCAVFGGNWGLEVSTVEPVLPATSRGLVRMQGVRFRAHGGDDAASRLAAELSADAELGKA